MQGLLLQGYASYTSIHFNTWMWENTDGHLSRGTLDVFPSFQGIIDWKICKWAKVDPGCSTIKLDLIWSEGRSAKHPVFLWGTTPYETKKRLMSRAIVELEGRDDNVLLSTLNVFEIYLWGRQTDRQADRQTDRQTGTHARTHNSLMCCGSMDPCMSETVLSPMRIWLMHSDRIRS